VTGPQWIDDGTDEPPQLQLPGFTTPAEHHELPVIGDTIFGINKKLVFVLAAVIVIVLYLKFRK
ncbi:MAG: hypothetical protein ACXVJE_19550, partial [Mucilaginibacter sp.]